MTATALDSTTGVAPRKGGGFRRALGRWALPGFTALAIIYLNEAWEPRITGPICPSSS